MKRFLILVVCLFVVIGCKSNQPKKDPKKIKASGPTIKVAFNYPVVQVNGRRVRKVDPFAANPEQLIFKFTQNTTNDISVVFLDSDGVERSIYGTIQVFSSKYKAPKFVPVKPLDYEYERIAKNGYGEIMVHEEVTDVGTEEKKRGKVLVKMILGSRNPKKKSNLVEFRFSEGSIFTVQGKLAPASFLFAEGSSNSISMTVDHGLVEVKGSLEVYKKTKYTQMAPVLIELNEKAMEIIKNPRGRLELALSVPKLDASNKKGFIVSAKPGQSATEAGNKMGTVVALLKLKKVSGY